MVTTIIEREATLDTLARDILSLCSEMGARATVVTLQGDLGAGKTALTKAIGRVLGVTSTVTSPTFVVMKSYSVHQHAFFKTLTHIDAYRIESEDEMRVIGLATLLEDPTQLICIEWPEKIPNCIPEDALTVSLSINKNNSRTIQYGK